MQNVFTLWSSLDLRRRLVVVGATIAMFAAVLGLSRMAAAPDMVLLYAGLEPGAAGEVIAALDQRGVKYDVSGDSILVDASQRDSLRMALVDPLTGLFIRRHAAQQLPLIAARAVERGRDVAVMVVDLDRFKAVNDQHGHAAGDAVLIEVARRLRVNLREGDLLARIGGEEFLAVLPDSSIPEARLVAERLCEAIDERPIRLATGQALKVTVSIGVAVSALEGGGALSVDRLVEQADLALLESKGAGRNQVTYRQSAA